MISASVDQPTNVAEPAPTVMGNEVNPVVNTSGDEAENSKLVGSLITENQPCTSEEVGSSLPIVDPTAENVDYPIEENVPDGELEMASVFVDAKFDATTQSTSACDPSPCLPSSKGEPPPKLTLDHQLVHSLQSLSAEPHDFC